MKATINLWLPYPISANRYWRHRSYRGRAIAYLSKEAANYRDDVLAVAEDAGVRKTEEPVIMVVTLHPKMTKKGRASKICLDIDNTLKVALDALEGIAYVDDKQVRALIVSYGEAVDGGALAVTIMKHEQSLWQRIVTLLNHVIRTLANKG
ncbi:RusA family crossover junction endodeoxyribonuclease [Oligella urethralis]|uniref:RusA family crossover junction endodeoxyribonuclease n=1 Tax=Oligella urethralis TaxID=90245 RepID=UPI000CFE5F86|nr:RusA family crossover junction endodeoxyribonuclease [Oligella urethralis]AVL70851.1 RusA family crossover junction endodeoxyribonuclease [Oligella urethralis]